MKDVLLQLLRLVTFSLWSNIEIMFWQTCMCAEDSPFHFAAPLTITSSQMMSDRLSIAGLDKDFANSGSRHQHQGSSRFLLAVRLVNASRGVLIRKLSWSD